MVLVNSLAVTVIVSSTPATTGKSNLYLQIESAVKSLATSSYKDSLLSPSAETETSSEPQMPGFRGHV